MAYLHHAPIFHSPGQTNNHPASSPNSPRHAARPPAIDLERFFRIRKPREVLAFLDAHRELEAVLLEAHKQIVRVFGESQELVLDMWPNPDEGSTGIVLLIRTTMPVDAILAKLEALDRSLEVPATTNRLLSILPEYL